MNHVISYSTSENDVTWVVLKSMFIYGCAPSCIGDIVRGIFLVFFGKCDMNFLVIYFGTIALQTILFILQKNPQALQI